MNRQMKRAQRRQGTQVDRAQAAAQRRAQLQQQKKERTGARQFLKEVRQELKKVIWPTRRELGTYTVVVLVTVIVLTSYVFGLDVLFSKFVLNVFTG
ncbi:MAG TPA: preprotein translocase subunit SecE [Actinomycetota bacterium]|jgi:preprotein translocase subunit SecE|nr:preprotein translocase subunit SecE [Actinomycetota bacterium]